MFLERLGKVFRSNVTSFFKKSADEQAKAIKYYKDYYKRHKKFPLFSQVLVETRTDCNMRCSFCPQSFKQREFKEMEWPTFAKIIKNLVDIGFSGRIAFFITNEPLLDERLVDMIGYARKASPRFFLDLNTNGNLLTLEITDQLFAAGLDNINIEDYRPDREEYPNQLSSNIEEISNTYRYNPKITYHYRSTKSILSNRAGNVVKKTPNDNINSFCNYPFRKIAISPYGDVVLCCMDYMYEVKLGNVVDNKLENIWHSDEINKYRFMLLKKRRKFFCSRCDASDY